MLIPKEKYTNEIIKSSMDVWNIVREIHFALPEFDQDALPEFDQDKEWFYVLGLTRANQIKYIDVVSVGSATTTVCEAREVFRMAIHMGVTGGIICAHNHPSGNLNPSDGDIINTRKLRAAGGILGIEVMDHVIFSREAYYSFADEDMFD